MNKTATLLLMVICLNLPSFGLVIGDFEGGSLDGWSGSGGTISTDTLGATTGAGSMKVVAPGGWGIRAEKNVFDLRHLFDEPDAKISMDISARSDDLVAENWCFVGILVNCDGHWGVHSEHLIQFGAGSSFITARYEFTLPQDVIDTLVAASSYASIGIMTNSHSGVTIYVDNIGINEDIPVISEVDVTVDAGSFIRTIPMTMYGGNLTAWDWTQNGTDTTYNNLLIASGRKYMRMPGGSWSDAHLWSDIEGPNNSQSWKVSYQETLNLLDAISQPAEEVTPMLQPVVNFPGYWYDTLQDDTPGDEINLNYEIAHQNAVDAAVAWVQDQSSRPVTAKYWEIGNEVSGPWEAGWFEGISGTYYGDYFADFYLAMKAENPDIKIGAVADPYHSLNPYGWHDGYWTYDTLTAAAARGTIPDFLIIHAYPGSGQEASYNPILLDEKVDEIADYTSSLDSIVTSALGPEYVGQIKYWMTEWDAFGTQRDTEDYVRQNCYVNAMFHFQYILEMAKHNWQGANTWAQTEYSTMDFVHPHWYVHPLMIHKFGRDLVSASTTDTIVRAYASIDANNNLTLLIVNNSPTEDITANIDISGFNTSSNAEQWLIEPAGSLIPYGVNIQDSEDLSINGIVHPDPLTVGSMSGESVTAGNSFALVLPKSSIALLKIPNQMQPYGDFTGDHLVNINDLSGFMNIWLSSDCIYDLDRDCKITLFEFAEMAQSWIDL